MHDTNTEHGRMNRGLILSFRASQMDDSSGDDRFSKFRAEKQMSLLLGMACFLGRSGYAVLVNNEGDM